MRRRTFFSALLLTFSCAAFSHAQVFDNPKLEYTIELPSASWKVISVPDDLSQDVEFINGSDRGEGLLRVRKEVVDSGVTATEMARRDQDQRLRFQPGYVDGKKDNFAGRVNGVVLSYQYTNGGKPMAGLIYYLQPDGRTIYTLRFTGRRDKLAQMRNQTDIMARSFQLK